MKVNAIINTYICGNEIDGYYKSECPYVYNGGCEDLCEYYIETSNGCRWLREKTKYIDKEIKEVEIEEIDSYGINDFEVTIGKKQYVNDYSLQEIKELNIDGKQIIKNYVKTEE